MSIEIGIIISLVGCIIAVISFILGQKKSGRDDGIELGTFMGEIRTEISNIKGMINDLKDSHKEVDEKIKDAMAEHVKAYHK